MYSPPLSINFILWKLATSTEAETTQAGWDLVFQDLHLPLSVLSFISKTIPIKSDRLKETSETWGKES